MYGKLFQNLLFKIDAIWLTVDTISNLDLLIISSFKSVHSITTGRQIKRIFFQIFFLETVMLQLLIKHCQNRMDWISFNKGSLEALFIHIYMLGKNTGKMLPKDNPRFFKGISQKLIYKLLLIWPIIPMQCILGYTSLRIKTQET